MKEEARQAPRPQPKPRAGTAAQKLRPNIQLKPKNWILLGVGIITIIAGYILLSRGSITMAPILLVAGYCVLVPIAILIK
jgi:uncharacterized membrane protein HdeD (DUF308 family)